jgi:hypothetical protein
LTERFEIAEKLWEIMTKSGAKHNREKPCYVSEIDGGIDALRDARTYLLKEEEYSSAEWPQNLMLDIGIVCTQDEALEVEDHLIYAVKTLSERGGKAVLLRYRQKLTFKDVGDSLGIRKERARQLVRQGVNRLSRREILDVVCMGERALRTISSLRMEYAREVDNLKAKIEETKGTGAAIPLTNDKDLSIYEKDISYLSLSVRSYNVLYRNNIKKIGQLKNVTREDLSNMRNAGAKSIEEIVEAARTFGIEIR